MNRMILAATLIAVLASTATAQDARTTIAAASKAMGADTLNTVEFSGSGADFTLGQAYSGTSPWPKFINKSYTRAVDFEKGASKVDRVRVQGENPPHGGGQQPIVGEQPQSQIIVVNASTPWAQELGIGMLPHGVLRAAAALVRPGGLLVVEHPSRRTVALPDRPGLRPGRVYRHGDSALTVMHRDAAPEGA